uniref:NADH-ubiquinone oxidoreductase chain 4 n=1 Tax=Russelliana solanicola TaxID=2008469 RepID=A0A344A2R8_9HEMI|nr:NADH dehydrogenase subunit 4 [Russelliana solanicola]AWU49059.1 NADH dehydrogenase subunit 4 [Russelliana solanicola]
MLEVLLSIGCVALMCHWMLTVNSLILFLLFLMLLIYDEGVYLLSVIFSMLSLWLIIMMLMSVDQSLKSHELLIICLLMIFSLIIVFISESMIMFYVGFEMSIIPILLIIFGWGYQPDRIEAGIYLLSYTVFFSLPLLLSIFYMDYFKLFKGFISCLMIFMAFLAKFPMVGVHVWLPRAHVEAPVFGSMILAGIMLKLGGYGLIKMSFLWGDLLFQHSSMIIVVSLIGGTLLSGVCFMQSDMKMLIAYSSIVHMSLVISGLFSMTELALWGSILIMMGHGFCSSGLFCVLGLTYNRTLSRSVYLNKGIISLMPICSLWWFLFCSSNLSFPPSMNLPGELFLFTAILSWSNNLFIFVIVFSLISSMYSIYLFSFSQQGPTMKFFSFNNITVKESVLMCLHWIPLNILILDLSVMSVY